MFDICPIFVCPLNRIRDFGARSILVRCYQVYGINLAQINIRSNGLMTRPKSFQPFPPFRLMPSSIRTTYIAHILYIFIFTRKSLGLYFVQCYERRSSIWFHHSSFESCDTVSVHRMLNQISKSLQTKLETWHSMPFDRSKGKR